VQIDCFENFTTKRNALCWRVLRRAGGYWSSEQQAGYDAMGRNGDAPLGRWVLNDSAGCQSENEDFFPDINWVWER